MWLKQATHFLVFLQIFVNIIYACPADCTCYLTSVICQYNFLKKIPNGIPESTTKLYLDGNQIERVERAELSNLKDLELLSIGSNTISFIEDDAFHNLTKLTSLHINDNKLTRIKRTFFSNSPLLRHVRADRLSPNAPLEIDDHAFENQQDLGELNLASNNMVRISNNTFAGLSNLKHLDISDNDIQVYSSHAFTPLTSSPTIEIDDGIKCCCQTKAAFTAFGISQTCINPETNQQGDIASSPCTDTGVCGSFRESTSDLWPPMPPEPTTSVTFASPSSSSSSSSVVATNIESSSSPKFSSSSSSSTSSILHNSSPSPSSNIVSSSMSESKSVEIQVFQTLLTDSVSDHVYTNHIDSASSSPDMSSVIPANSIEPTPVSKLSVPSTSITNSSIIPQSSAAPVISSESNDHTTEILNHQYPSTVKPKLESSMSMQEPDYQTSSKHPHAMPSISNDVDQTTQAGTLQPSSNYPLEVSSIIMLHTISPSHSVPTLNGTCSVSTCKAGCEFSQQHCQCFEKGTSKACLITSTLDSQTGDENSMADWQMAIIIGSCVVVLCFIVFFIYFKKKQSRERQFNLNTSRQNMAMNDSPQGRDNRMFIIEETNEAGPVNRPIAEMY
eukprot:TCONS_00055914-protein